MVEEKLLLTLIVPNVVCILNRKTGEISFLNCTKLICSSSKTFPTLVRTAISMTAYPLKLYSYYSHYCIPLSTDNNFVMP
jgi:hypothetical protein